MPQESLKIQSRQGNSPETRILAVIGPITLSVLPAFQSELRKECPPLTILDLSAVPYVESCAVGAIIAYYVHAQRVGHKIILAAVNKRIYTLLELTKTTKLLKVVSKVADAE